MRKAIVFFLIPVFITILGVIAANSFKKPEAVRLPAAYGPGTGYELVPEQWTITASSHYKWNHGTSPGWLWIVGIVLFAAGGFYVYFIDREVKVGTWTILAVLWLGGMACIFGKHVVKYHKSPYVQTISKEKYEVYKDNLDTIFQP